MPPIIRDKEEEEEEGKDGEEKEEGEEEGQDLVELLSNYISIGVLLLLYRHSTVTLPSLYRHSTVIPLLSYQWGVVPIII